MKTKNYYRLTKKQLCCLKSIEEPVFSEFNGKPITKPVVVALNPSTKDIVSIYSLTIFKYKTNNSYLSDYFEYHLKVVF